MKNKIIIIILIIAISFLFGFGIHTFKNYLNNKEIENQYLSITGTVEQILDNIIYLTPDTNSQNQSYAQITFDISKASIQNLVVGDIIKVKYLDEAISEDGFISNPIIEQIGKARLFTYTNTPVSNSESNNSRVIFKSFYAYSNELNLNNFSNQNDFYYKKITSYNEYLKYKELIPELRNLTENDFIYYYLVIVLSQDVEHIYTFEEYKTTENTIDLTILKNKTLSPLDSIPLYSGVAIVLPNVSDFPEEAFNIVNE